MFRLYNMFKIKRKTEKELIRIRVKVNNSTSGFTYFSCEKCKIAFIDNDEILAVYKNEADKNVDHYACPKCYRCIYGGNESAFYYYYKIIKSC